MQAIYDHLPSWHDFVERVVTVLVTALEMMHQMDDLPAGEKALNLRLSSCIRRANRQMSEQRRGIPWPPSFDGIQGMSPDDTEPLGHEETCPDCRWGLVDMQGSQNLMQEKHFDIECKRLGSPSSRTWRLNERYILDGVLRFIQVQHSYGRGVDRGAMVGYVQSMEMDDIWSEVNEHGRTNDVVIIERLDEEWQNDISKLRHSFARSVECSPFLLEHFWVDLRRE